MKSFLAGVAVGLGLGVLFAPMSGDQLRDTVSTRAGDFADSARDTYGRMRETAESAISSIRGSSEARTGTEA
jgi:gas vesicle protein